VLKITNFGDDVHFLHAFHLKFTINANTVHSNWVKIQLVQCPFHSLITTVSILTADLSLHVLCPELPNPSSLTECTSNNRCLGTYNFCWKALHTEKSTGLRYSQFAGQFSGSIMLQYIKVQIRNCVTLTLRW